jgi:hypothetical protein
MKNVISIRLTVLIILSFVCLQKNYCQLANSPWPMEGHDYMLHNSTSSCGPNLPGLKWSKQFNNQFIVGMSVDVDGTIYVNANCSYFKKNMADSLGYLYKINSVGDIKWNYIMTDGSPMRSPSVGSNGVIYVHADGNEANIAAPEKLYAIDTTGTLQWMYTPGSAVFTGGGSCPSIWDDGTIFFGSKGCVLFRMNSNGTVNHVYNSPSVSSISETVPLSSNGRFYLEGKVYNFKGDYLWSTRKDNWEVTPDINGTVYCVNGGYNGAGHDSLYIYNPDGTIKNSLSLPWGHDSKLAAMNDSFMIFTKAPSIDSISVYIMTKDGTNFTQIARKFDRVSSLSIKIDDDNTIYILVSQGGHGNRLYAYYSNGTEKWHFIDFFNYGSYYAYPSKLILGTDKTLYVTHMTYYPDRSFLYAIGEMPIITGTTDGSRCGTGTVTLGATASAGTINWYSASTGGSSLGTGTSFTTPVLTTTTVYYVDATNNGCTTAKRTAITAYITCPVSTQQIELKAGWNIFSVCLTPENPDMKVLFQPLITDGSLVKIQDETGNSLEDMGILGGWTNSIGNISSSEGYKIKVTRNCQFEVTGNQVALPMMMTLKTGWNIIGYPKQAQAETKAVVQQLIDRHTLIKVQDESGNAFEDYGLLGGWQNNIGNFKPGEGYKIKVNANDNLTIFESYTK